MCNAWQGRLRHGEVPNQLDGASAGPRPKSARGSGVCAECVTLRSQEDLAEMTANMVAESNTARETPADDLAASGDEDMPGDIEADQSSIWPEGQSQP